MAKPRSKSKTKAARAGVKAAGRPKPGPAAKPKIPTAERRDARQLGERLARAVPDARVELDHTDAWQLLVATILSAQSTDRTINRITPALFERFPTPAALGAAEPDEVEQLVRSSGYFRVKAKAIRDASRMLAERFDGTVPRRLEQVLELPGVARKTANLVLGAAYGIASGITVDTHVARVAQRLGLSKSDDAGAVEADLCARFDQDAWIGTGFRLLLHGRYVCTAKAPRCSQCPLNELCPSREVPGQGPWSRRAADEAEQIRVASESAHVDPVR